MLEKPTYEQLEKRVKALETSEDERKQAEKALQESETRFRKIAENSLVGINIIQDDILVYVNPKFAEIFGYTVEECLDKMQFQQLVYPKDLHIVKKNIHRRMSGEAQFVQYDFRGIKKGGEIIHVEILGSSMKIKGRAAVMGSILDITARNRLEEKLLKSEKRFRSFFEESKDAIVNTDMEGNLLLVNPSGMELFGLTDSQLDGINFRDLYVEPAIARQFSAAIQEKGHIRDFGIQLYGKDRKVMDCLMTVVTKQADDGTLLGYEGIIRDVSPYKKLEQELRRLATIDSLTNINNRRNFLELAHKEIARSMRYNHSFSMVMLDIDFFKKVNDTYGHSVGDQVLIEFCKVCMQELRDEDIMGRLGGEEFAIALVECDTAEAVIVAERIRQAVASHTVITGKEEIGITVSLGVVGIWKDCDLNSMIGRADKALYKAKKKGRNQIQIFEQ